MIQPCNRRNAGQSPGCDLTGPQFPHDEVRAFWGTRMTSCSSMMPSCTQKVRKLHLLGLVDDEAHGAFVAVGADIDDGASEAVVLHAGHGDEELVVEKSADCGFSAAEGP